MATRRPKPPRHPIPLLAEAQEHFHKHPTPDTAEQQLSWAQNIVAFLFKRASKHLSGHLATRHGLRLTHGQALNAVSASFGFADWNTASATVYGVVERLAAAELAGSASAPAPARTGLPASVAQTLATSLSVNESRLIVGPAGVGKTFGLLLALQRQAWHRESRPVMAIHFDDQDSLYQPNWSGFGRALRRLHPGATGQVSFEPHADWAAKDVVFIAPTFEHAPDRDYQRMTLVMDCLKWLRANAHRKPLLLLDEVALLLGPCAAALFAGLPPEVTVICAVQTLSDMASPEMLERFEYVHMMRSFKHHAADLHALADNNFHVVAREAQGHSHVPMSPAQLGDVLEHLKQGQAVELQQFKPQATDPLHQEPL
jgi:hypothetical protein